MLYIQVPELNESNNNVVALAPRVASRKPNIQANCGHQLFVRPVPWWKRPMDIVGALCALTLFSPLMLVLALAIKVTSPGPVFFAQRRGGIGGKPFSMYKFRSMYVGAEARRMELLRFNERSGPVFKMEHDPRITAVGRFIRKTSLDELPQLFNVLLGHMSLVGPRPLPVTEEKGYSHWHWRRLDVKPGLTCIWQVHSRHDRDFDNWVRLDLQYIRERSFLLDVQLLAMTVPAVIAQRGAC